MSKQTGFAQTLLLILLLSGIALGVYLVGQQTNLLPKAFSPKQTEPEVSFSLSGQGDCVNFLCPLMPQKDIQPGEEFELKLYVRSDIDEANLFQARMSFPKDLVEVMKINTDGSFIKNWIENYYDNSTGQINLTGGVPSPGFQTKFGSESALMATIVFKAKVEGKGTASFNDDSAIYRNTDNENILKIKRDFNISIGTTSPVKEADLDVTYIERTPKYSRYRVTYFSDRSMCAPENPNFYPYSEDRGPQLCPGENGKKRWPTEGEQVTFTVYIKNNGSTPTGNFGFKWFIDGLEVKSGTHNSIDTGQMVNETFQWTWPPSLDDHKVKFVADPSNLITEKHETNNEVEDYTNALYFFIAVNNTAYNSLKNQAASSMPSSPEDWIKAQINRMNALFASSNVLEHVRIDKLVVSDSDFSASDKYSADGTWFITSDYRTTSGYYDSTEDIDYGLLHELIHQLGIIDLYNMNSDIQYDKLLDRKYNKAGAGCGTEYGWPNSWSCYSLSFAQPSIGNDLANEVAHQIGLHTANALNKNLHKRRGYFGEYLFDMPETIKVRFLQSNGRPLGFATVKVYQPGSDRIINSTKLKQTLTTDASGTIVLNSVKGEWVTTNKTETGHQLKPNPYGLINVVGGNGLFLFEIEKGNDVDYKWLPLALANVEYWKGNTSEVTFVITAFTSTTPVPTNSPSTPPSPQKGDGNTDGKINLTDMSVLLTDFNKEKGFREPIDMNDDKKINTFDFSLHRKLLIDLGVIKGQ